MAKATDTIMIEVMHRDNQYKYMDFIIEGIEYRYYEGEDKFSKLLGFPSDYSKAIRGKRRAAVLPAVKEIYKMGSIKIGCVQI